MTINWNNYLNIGAVERVQPVAGGSINKAYQVVAGGEKYFLLVQPDADVHFYDAEIAGLKLFDDHGIRGPRVIDSGQAQGNAYLLLSYLEEVSHGSQTRLGEMVAKLHQVHSHSGEFGFDYPTEMADLSFTNQWTDTWYDQFVTGRLDGLYEKIKRAGYFNDQEQALADEVYHIISEELRHHKPSPSLLHGDLWSGNYMFVQGGAPALFDPAPFYGDREFDLGATLTFGGFSRDFYEAYDQAYPLDDKAWGRIEFYNLYLLIVHLVKFGSSYKGSVIKSMRKIQEHYNN